MQVLLMECQNLRGKRMRCSSACGEQYIETDCLFFESFYRIVIASLVPAGKTAGLINPRQFSKYLCYSRPYFNLLYMVYILIISNEACKLA